MPQGPKPYKQQDTYMAITQFQSLIYSTLPLLKNFTFNISVNNFQSYNK